MNADLKGFGLGLEQFFPQFFMPKKSVLVVGLFGSRNMDTSQVVRSFGA